MAHMSATCVRCGRPTDATVCQPEARALADELVAAAGHAEDAEAVLTGQVRYGGGARGGNNEDPMPNLGAAARYRRIEKTITTWTRHVLETRGVQPSGRQPRQGPLCARADCDHGSCESIRLRRPLTGLAEAAGWLATQTGWLRKRPEAAKAFRDLEKACDDLAVLVDRPADNRHLVGVCNCGKILYAPWDWTVIQCRERTCGAVWSLADGQDILMRHLDDKLMTGGEASRLAAYLDTSRTQDNIRKLIDRWAGRSLLVAHGYVMRDPTDAELKADPDAGPVAVSTYRFGDVRAQLAQTPRRNREGAAA